jgi:hypothetical protein
MPAASVRVCLGVGCFGEGAVYTTPVLSRSRAVGGRSDEWMGELHAPADMEQLGVHRREGCNHVKAEGIRGTVEQQGSPSGSAAAVRTSNCVLAGSRRRRRT